MSKQTAVDLFHDRVNELIAGAKSINSNSVAKIWLECKAMEREQIEEAYYDGTDLNSMFTTASEYYEQTYGKEAGHEG